jgi:two-component system chemotaxis sensor kinase CheA
VSEVSGRGVGMDVVNTNLKKLSGNVQIDSEVGRGTSVTLQLPLTLAVLPVLLVRVDRETYALPLHSVVETTRVSAKEVHGRDGNEMLRLRDRVLPLLRLGNVLHGICGDRVEANHLRVVVIALGEIRVGLVVDQLLGQEETVIKPLNDYLRAVPGLAGATIGGDGQVRLILDPAGVVAMANNESKLKVGAS